MRAKTCLHYGGGATDVLHLEAVGVSNVTTERTHAYAYASRVESQAE